MILGDTDKSSGAIVSGKGAGKSRNCCDLRRWQSGAGFSRVTGYERTESVVDSRMSL